MGYSSPDKQITFIGPHRFSDLRNGVFFLRGRADSDIYTRALSSDSLRPEKSRRGRNGLNSSRYARENGGINFLKRLNTRTAPIKGQGPSSLPIRFLKSNGEIRVARIFNKYFSKKKKTYLVPNVFFSKIYRILCEDHFEKRIRHVRISFLAVRPDRRNVEFSNAPI